MDLQQGANTQRALYSREDAARYLGVSIRKIDQLIHRGAFRTIQIDRRRAIERSALDAFIEQNSR